MKRETLVFRAALARIALGVFTLVLLPLLYPKLERHLELFAAYVVFGVGMQILIWRQIGGVVRAVLSGLIDMAFLTFIVHSVGSVSTMMVSLYLFAGIMNTLLVSFWVGIALASVGVLAYTGVLIAERVGWLPYAPDAPFWASGLAPGTYAVITASVLLALVVLMATTVVGLLVKTVRHREAELVVANVRLEELSLRDPLTQLYNRRYLFARTQSELQRVRRGHPLALIMIDLDGFKRVNDQMGHLQGDRLLKELADAIAGAIRATDVAGRYGGDEFVVLLPDTDPERARGVAERLVSTISSVGERFSSQAPVTASVGVAVARSDDAEAQLLRRADDQAYRAKKLGGDRVLVEDNPWLELSASDI
jgi:diguanylate cyclase (GGDEF)-like protein